MAETFKINVEYKDKVGDYEVTKWQFKGEKPHYYITGRKGTSRLEIKFSKWQCVHGVPLDLELVKIIGEAIESEEKRMSDNYNKTGDFWPDVFPDE